MAKQATHNDLAAQWEASEKASREAYEKLSPEEKKKYRRERKLLEERWNEVPY